MNRLLLAGVGDLNRRLARLALAQQVDVIGLRRGVADRALAFAQHSLDLATQPWPDYQADAVVMALSARERSVEAYRAAYVAPIERLSESLSNWSQRPKRIVVVSSTRVYGEDSAQTIDDDTVPQTDDEYGQILLEMEQKAQQFPCEVVIARLSGIYGPGRDWLKRMALAASEDSPPDNSWTNRIHIDDAAAALWHLVQKPSVAPSYLVTDPAPQTRYAMYNYFREQAGMALLLPEPEADSGKRLLPTRLSASGFQWRYPDAFSGGYDR